MGVRKRNGMWHYRFELSGKEYSGSTGLQACAANRKAALEFQANERRRIESEAKVTPVSGLPECAAEFICWCRDVEYRRKPNTSKRIKGSFASIVEFFGDVAVDSIDAGALEQYKTHRKRVNQVQDVTLRHDLHALSLFFRYAIKMHWTDSNPVREVTIPSDADALREHVLTTAEEDAYFSAISAADDPRGGMRNLYDVARLILNQGMRPEEIMGAPKDAFDPRTASLRIVSGKSRAARRTLGLTEDSVRILDYRMDSEGPWLFPGYTNPLKPITSLQGPHDKACMAAGVSFVIYDLRHTFATRAAESGMGLLTLANILGHANLRSIMRYVHITEEHARLAMKKFEAAQKRRTLSVVV